jgi:hypothetical protein
VVLFSTGVCAAPQVAVRRSVGIEGHDHKILRPISLSAADSHAERPKSVALFDCICYETSRGHDMHSSVPCAEDAGLFVRGWPRSPW